MNKKFNNKSRIIFGGFAICCLVYLSIAWVDFIRAPLIKNDEKPVIFLYTQGSSVRSLVQHLKHLGVIKHPTFFLILAKFDSRLFSLRAGQYQIDPGMKPSQLLRRMMKGEVMMHSFTVVEGWTFRQMLDALEANPYVTHLMQGMSDDAIMKEIGHEGENSEGRFAPDTFLFHMGMKDAALLKLSYNLMEKRLSESWMRRALNVPYHCPYEALIVASIIERETAVPSERPRIAGVIKLRLAKNMALGMDSTVFYGLNKEYAITGKITASDWKRDTAYNTYTRRGFPPTPIAMPSLASLQAALHPLESNDLYFVAKGDGSHTFSKTFAEHNIAVIKYRSKK